MPTTQPISIPWDHITSLVVALTGLVAALTALRKIGSIKAAAQSATDTAREAKTTATDAATSAATNKGTTDQMSKQIDNLNTQVTIAAAMSAPPTPAQFVPPLEPTK